LDRLDIRKITQKHGELERLLNGEIQTSRPRELHRDADSAQDAGASREHQGNRGLATAGRVINLAEFLMAQKTEAGQSQSVLAEIRDTLLETYASNDGMNQVILSSLEPRAWRAEPPGKKGNGRSIAAIFAHLHNCRLVWLKNSAPHLKCPVPLDPDRCTMKQAAAAHRKSAAQCLRMLTDALSADPNRRVTKFSRGSWTRTWPAGGTMFAYMFSHEAHHRGQILMLAHQLGYRVLHDTPGVWHWEKLWKKAGLNTRPR
jgi:uncharacterized damage-inducible protein DinB